MATKSKRLCPKCGSIVEGICPICTKTYNTTVRSKEEKRVYGSKRWQTTRKAVLYRDEGLCQVCKVNPATEVDHIKELRDIDLKTDLNAAYDMLNLQSICTSCHVKKTNDEKNRRKY